MTTKTMTREQKRELTGVRCNHPKLTDQSQAAAADINNIAAQYQRTGILPQPTKIPKYQDNTQAPTLEDAFRAVSEAKSAFQNLPASIRKLMDNDPAKMEAFISNPDNADILLKHGIIEIQKTPEPEVTLKDIQQTLKENQKPTEKV